MFNYLYSTICSTLTVTVSVYSSDPPWKDGNAGFTTVNLDQKCERYRRGIDTKSVYFCEFPQRFL